MGERGADWESVNQRYVRSAPATAVVVIVFFVFALSPLSDGLAARLGYGLSISLPTALVSSLWTVVTALAFHRGGLHDRRYRWLNRGERVLFGALTTFVICASANPVSPLWLLHLVHVVTSGMSGAERTFNLRVFAVVPLAAVLFFGVTQGPASGALVAAIAATSLYAYVAMAKLREHLTETIAQRDRLQDKLTSLSVSEERARIARDLHDGVGTELSSLFWQLQSLKRSAAPDVQASLDSLTQRITQSTDELRNVVWELRATSLEWPDLVAHLRTRCLDLAGDEATVTLSSSGREAIACSGDLRMNVARIVQEAVRNAIHHGHARKVDLRLAVNEALVIEIDDDGDGIAPDAARRSVGGIRNIQVRVANQRGTLAVSRREGGGTALRIVLPLEEQGTNSRSG
ncbi:MAG: sensor histidine kinase [Myxococcaceae bacterium]|nr:sensor histidine kinase [Myxococcaceae bacterium]